MKQQQQQLTNQKSGLQMCLNDTYLGTYLLPLFINFLVFFLIYLFL